MACKVPNYIQKENLSLSEQERLSELNIQIFQEAVNSKSFRHNNGKLYSLKHNISLAYQFVSNINSRYNAKVASIETEAPGVHKLQVNVLPLTYLDKIETIIKNLESSGELKIECN
jgi:hypothetical protein